MILIDVPMPTGAIDCPCNAEESTESERKTGMWIAIPTGYHCCSICRSVACLNYYGDEVLSKFCPNCGSEMRGEKNGDNNLFSE